MQSAGIKKEADPTGIPADDFPDFQASTPRPYVLSEEMKEVPSL